MFGPGFPPQSRRGDDVEREGFPFEEEPCLAVAHSGLVGPLFDLHATRGVLGRLIATNNRVSCRARTSTSENALDA